jgi:carboxyl-terminal processing protease
MGRSKLKSITLPIRNYLSSAFQSTTNTLKVQSTLIKVFLSGVSAISVLGFTPYLSSALPRSTSLLINESPKEVLDQVWQIVYRDYLDSSGDYDSKEWIALRKKLLGTRYVDSSETYEAIRGMLATLNDPYTRFLDPKEFKEMRIDTSGQLTGVGIQLSLDKNTNDLIVISPIEGTPAFQAGVQPRDVIVSINDQSTRGMTIENAVKLIRGRKGTEVTLGLQRNNKLIKIQIVRDKIAINAVDSKLNRTNNGHKIGYIRLKQFNANAVREMRKAIKGLEDQSVSGYVLDLRSNPGGLLEASVEISRLWLDDGIIVRTETRDGVKDVRRARGKALTLSPVVVLVDSGSASASEILSGAIQDNERGKLVGEKTFGKGLVQSVRALSDGSGLTVTVAKYLTPSGRDIHTHGIIPDVLSKMSEKDMLKFTKSDFGTVNDTQYIVAETVLVKNIMRVREGTTFKSKYYQE